MTEMEKFRAQCAYNKSFNSKEHTDDLTDLIERIKLLIEIDESDVSEFYQRLARRKPYEPTHKI